MSKVVIEKNIPLPVKSRLPQFQLERLVPGDSVKVAATTHNEKRALRQRLWRFKKTHPSVQFSMKTLDEEFVRIFRMEDVE